MMDVNSLSPIYSHILDNPNSPAPYRALRDFYRDSMPNASEAFDALLQYKFKELPQLSHGNGAIISREQQQDNSANP